VSAEGRRNDRGSGGHYVMLVKENQGHLLATLELLLASPVSVRVPDRMQTSQSEVGHGRIERREIVSSEVAAARIGWPGVRQIFQVRRERTQKKTGQRETETVYGITSLTAKQADMQVLLGLVRGHWKIENQSHYVRDVTFDEDRSQARSGSLPQVMAALRNTAIGLIRLAGRANVAAACRYYAARPWEAVALLRLPAEN
jgi:predicted transposase YbfD/YdcC